MPELMWQVSGHVGVWTQGCRLRRLGSGPRCMLISISPQHPRRGLVPPMTQGVAAACLTPNSQCSERWFLPESAFTEAPAGRARCHGGGQSLDPACMGVGSREKGVSPEMAARREGAQRPHTRALPQGHKYGTWLFLRRAHQRCCPCA